MEEIVIGILVLLVLALLIATPILLAFVLVGLRRVRALARRLEQVEHQVGALGTGAPAAAGPFSGPPPATAAAPIEPPPVPTGVVMATAAPEPSRAAISWELLIGRKALGWAAVVVLIFATAFFLRYAFQNQWIGPLGRVGLGLTGGTALVVAGWWHHRRGWRVFSQMLSAGGVVLLYLSAFSAFGFYHLIGEREAAVFLVLIVAESALLALCYDSMAVALMAVVGGLLVPLLMRSDHDQYAQIFTYLGVLNAGVACLVARRPWPGIGTLALVGTQGLFWLWHVENYHPEKLGWAIGFQGALYAIYLGHSLLACGLRRRSTWEEVVRLLLNALLGFVAAYVLLREDYRPWMGSLAVAMAAVYAALGRISLANAADGGRLLLVSVAVASGFMALAFPLEARAEWIALGWAAEAAVLWWFGLRVRTGPLRALAAALAVLAVGRLVLFDTPWDTRTPFVPIFNDYALPALAVVACLAGGLAAARRFVPRLVAAERALVGLAIVGCLLLVWWVVSFDLYGFFDAQAAVDGDAGVWRRLGQMSLSAWWAVYATLVLAAGFRGRMALLRWTALGLYAMTVGKVFLYDIAGLDAIYRIVAFFVVALLLGAGTWAYQRIQPERAEGEPPQPASPQEGKS